MVGEGVVFQGMRGYTVPPHAPAVACFTMSVTQHIWLKKKYYRVPIFNPVVSEATRLSYLEPNMKLQGLISRPGSPKVKDIGTSVKAQVDNRTQLRPSWSR